MTKPKVQPATYSVAECSVLFGISRSSVLRMIREGELPVIRLGRRVVVARPVVERLLRTGSVR